MKKVLGCMRKADEDWDLINDNDVIAIGISGGKDSLLMTKALSLYRLFSQKNFKIIGITVDLGFEGTDFSKVEEFCKELEVEYHIVKTQIGEIIFDIRKEKNPCSLCAKMRKGALYEKAKELGCNKVALGHHRDDLIDTFMLSLLYEGQLNALKPKMYLSRRDITAIRPLIYLPECYVVKNIDKQNLPVVESPCPANGETKRDEIRDLVSLMCSKFPDFKDKVFTAIYGDHNYNLWDNKVKKED